MTNESVRLVASDRLPLCDSPSYEYDEPPLDAAVDTLRQLLVVAGVWPPPGPTVPAIADPGFRSFCRECVYAVRGLMNRLDRDQLGYRQFLPDGVYNAYVVAFKYVFGDDIHQNDMVAQLGSRYGNLGFVNRGIFPDGRGGCIVDDYGFGGTWYIELPSDAELTNGEIMRVADAVNIAVTDSGAIADATAREWHLAITDDAAGGAQDEGGAAAVADPLSDGGRLCVSIADARKPRHEQVDTLAPRAALIPQVASRPKSPGLLAPPRRPSPSAGPVVVCFLGVSSQGRGRDYFHAKFNYRVEAYTEQFAERTGAHARFISLEAERDMERVADTVTRLQPSLVVLSAYQAKEADVSALHHLLPRLRAASPRSVVALEGPATMHGKQILALAPDVDILVRGEIDTLLADIWAVGDRSEWSAPSARWLAARIGSGVFIRTPTLGVIADLATTVVSRELRMVAPRREMSAVWYTEHGCPHRCAFCRLDTGQTQNGRTVSAAQRIDWLLERLRLEFHPHDRPSATELRELLAKQAHDERTIRDVWSPRLRTDTFVGRDLVDIVVVSESSLGPRQTVTEFFATMTSLGLQKYFRVKLADVTNRSLLRGGEPNLELIELLRAAQVYFIGFGTDNLSRELLRDLNKDFYDIDQVLALNKALIEASFPVGGIRHNLVMSSPESSLAAVKTSILLTFLAPIYNSTYWMLGHGWGNSRNSKVHAIEGNLYKARDAYVYGPFYWFDRERLAEDGRPFAVIDEHFVPTRTPDYSIRREPSRLNYRDERIYSLCADFAWPTFYRYHQIDHIRVRFTDADYERAIAAWAGSSSPQENALAELLTVYATGVDNRMAECVRILKAHLLACESYSFVDYLHEVHADPRLPVALQSAGVDQFVHTADEFMRPGTFDGVAALQQLLLANTAARAVRHLLSADPRSTGSTIGSAVTDLLSRGCGGSEDESGLRALMRRHELMSAEIERADIRDRFAHPDQQSIEYLSQLYTHLDGREVVALVTDAINEFRVDLATAVQRRVVQDLQDDGIRFDSDAFRQLVRTLSDYKSRAVFCPGGLLFQVRDSDPGVRRAAAKQLVALMDERLDFYFCLPVCRALVREPHDDGSGLEDHHVTAELLTLLTSHGLGTGTQDGDEVRLGRHRLLARR